MPSLQAPGDGQQFPYQVAVEALLWQILQDTRQDSHARHTLLGLQGPFHLSPGPLDVGMHPLSDGVALSPEKAELLNQVEVGGSSPAPPFLEL